ncbi:MAG: site-specific DNA-methyltransferase [Christensenellaceae bacterium]|jgi:adenine-specific DNA-methyltransferase|nr:site-specific DNA-methyltransferase [Christensenellaceae bacterium]
MDKLKMQTPNNATANVARIAELFPNCVTEAVINDKQTAVVDFDLLRQELSDFVVEGADERYQFTWADKRKSILLANSPISKTLRPSREESVNFDTTKNLYIDGDNLDVLKLLQETYIGKVKVIYIDPPYNTGSDFVYEDDFSISTAEYLARSGIEDEYGNRLFQNNDSNGRFHTDWLNMIYPRLKLARDLLTDDGVIFISIDDNEQSNLKKVCDEIFGAGNFIAEFPRVTKRGGKSTETYAKNHDYILAYAKSFVNVCIEGITHCDDGFKFKDEFYEKRGAYKLNQTLDYNTLQYNRTMDYPLQIGGKIYVPGGDIETQKQRHNGKHGQHDWVWRWSKSLFDFGYKNGWIEISKTGRIYTKTYLNAQIVKNAKGEYYIEYKERTKAVSTLEFTENSYSNDNSNKEITGLMGSTMFDYVKPTALVKMLLQTCAGKEGIILDFFSGSATTAHAVMQKNAEDGGTRKYILVQLPEIIAENSEARKAGFKNICEIGRERIRRAGAKIASENRITAPNLDIGFRVLKLDTSNMKPVYYNPENSEFTQSFLSTLESNIKEDRTPEDLLFQVMLDMGVDLSKPITIETIAGKKVFTVGGDNLICCFDDNVNKETVTAIAKYKPLFAVFRDGSFKDDSTMVSFDQIFATYSPTTERRVI